MGVYVGGTGGTNHLDDYEEGTWTPTFDTSNASSTVTVGGYAVQSGMYTKVGRLVYVQGALRTSSAGVTVSNSSGTWDIGGLPFTINSGGADGHSSELLAGAQADWSVAPHKFTTIGGTTRARARGGIDVGDASYTNGTAAMFYTGSGTNNRVYFWGAYITQTIRYVYKLIRLNLF